MLLWVGGAVGGWVVGFCGVVGRTEGALAEEPEQIEVPHAAQRSFGEGASALHMHDSMGGSQLLQETGRLLPAVRCRCCRTLKR